MIYIILALIFYSAAIMAGSFASRRADSNIVAGLINIIASIVPVVVVAFGWREKLKASSSKGLVFALLAGAAIGLFSMALTKAYSQNNVAIVAPIVFGGAIAITSVLGVFIFKEKIVALQGVGLTLVVIGLGLVVLAHLRHP